MEAISYYDLDIKATRLVDRVDSFVITEPTVITVNNSRLDENVYTIALKPVSGGSDCIQLGENLIINKGYNLLINPDFDDGLHNWEYNPVDVGVWIQDGMIEVVSPGIGNSVLHQDVDVVPETKYRACIRSNSMSHATDFRLAVDWKIGSTVIETDEITIPSTDDWSYEGSVFEAPATVDNARIKVLSGVEHGILVVDTIEFFKVCPTETLFPPEKRSSFIGKQWLDTPITISEGERVLIKDGVMETDTGKMYIQQNGPSFLEYDAWNHILINPTFLKDATLHVDVIHRGLSSKYSVLHTQRLEYGNEIAVRRRRRGVGNHRGTAISTVEGSLNMERLWINDDILSNITSEYNLEFATDPDENITQSFVCHTPCRIMGSSFSVQENALCLNNVGFIYNRKIERR